MLHEVVEDHVPSVVKAERNVAKSWKYGYDKKYDLVVISKDGTVGEIYKIAGIYIGLPKLYDNHVISRSDNPKEQYWERPKDPKLLELVKSANQWNGSSNDFKTKWLPYINREFDRRANGTWFMNDGVPTYITGSHYFYLQWAKIDVGYPDFRYANRIYWIFWEACKADERCYGLCYVKNRRSGFSFMAASECINIGTLAKNARLGMLSKTGDDAKMLFIGKVVPINTKLPFFFKPIMSGMDKGAKSITYDTPAKKLTLKNMLDGDEAGVEGLNTIIDYKNTADNSYDSEKMTFLISDEAGKWTKPNDIRVNWDAVKTTMRLGSNVVGKCMMGSTVNAMAKGGDNFLKLYNGSDPHHRQGDNGGTKSGMYRLFIPMEWNYEGCIDRYGMPVFYNPLPNEFHYDVFGNTITKGAIDDWQNECDAKKYDSERLNEHYRQYPRTLMHAFRDEYGNSVLDLTKIYEQIEYVEGLRIETLVTSGNFQWENGVVDSKVVWYPDKNGRFNITWHPPKDKQNNIAVRLGVKHPGNEDLGAFGCDPYDIDVTVDGRGSKGAMHGMTGYTLSDVPSNHCFLEYVARPQMAEVFFEDVLMACVYYGMPILIENNKTRLLYHFLNRGYRGYSLTRPDRPTHKLSDTEKLLGGIPGSGEDIIQTHAQALDSYIKKRFGYDRTGEYRHETEPGDFYFMKSLVDLTKFDIRDRTKSDASMSLGYALMAVNRMLYKREVKQNTISVNFAKYDNKGSHSRIWQTR